MADAGRMVVNSFFSAARIPFFALIWMAAYAPVWIPLAAAYRHAARIHRQRAAIREAREWQARRESAVGHQT